MAASSRRLRHKIIMYQKRKEYREKFILTWCNKKRNFLSYWTKLLVSNTNGSVGCNSSHEMIFDDMIMTFVSIMVNLFTWFHSKVIDEDPVVDGKVWPDELEEEKVRRPKPTTTRKTWTIKEVKEIGEYLGHHLTNKTTPYKECEVAKRTSGANNGEVQHCSIPNIITKISALNHKK